MAAVKRNDMEMWNETGKYETSLCWDNLYLSKYDIYSGWIYY